MDLYPGGTYITTPGLGIVSKVGGEIDLRKELHVILNGDSAEPQRGHWVVFRRMDITKKSKYYDQVTGEGKGGSMYPYTDELWLTRKVRATTRTAIMTAEQDAKPGLIPVSLITYYFPYNLNPKLEDEIYEINWEDHSIKPDLATLEPYKERMNIKIVQDLRDINGRIEYWSILTTGDSTTW